MRSRIAAKCLALVADTSLPGLRVMRELDNLVTVRGCPAMCVSDNGTELTSMAILRGRRSGGSSGTTSHQDNRSRMPLERPSSGGYVMSC